MMRMMTMMMMMVMTMMRRREGGPMIVPHPRSMGARGRSVPSWTLNGMSWSRRKKRWRRRTGPSRH